MNDKTLKAAMDEAYRFLRTARTLQEAQSVDKIDVSNRKAQGETHVYHKDFPKLTGAVRRASMDLTRSLAEMRRP